MLGRLARGIDPAKDALDKLTLKNVEVTRMMRGTPDATDDLTCALAGEGEGDGKSLKAALQDSAEQAAELRRRLDDLTANQPAVAAMRARAEGLGMELDALEGLTDAQARHAAQAELGYTAAGALREEAIVGMRVETAILENQIRQAVRLLYLEVRRRLVGETARQRELRTRFPRSTPQDARGPSPLPGVEVDVEDVRGVGDMMAGSLDRK